MNQRDFGLLGSLPPPALLPEADIALCKTFRDALGLCIQRSRVRRSQGDLARSVGIHPTQFSKILNGAKGQRWNLAPEKIAAIEQNCGNHALTQWLAAQANLHVIADSPENRRIRMLEAQLAELQRRAA